MVAVPKDRYSATVAIGRVHVEQAREVALDLVARVDPDAQPKW